MMEDGIWWRDRTGRLAAKPANSQCETQTRSLIRGCMQPSPESHGCIYVTECINVHYLVWAEVFSKHSCL